MRHTLKNKRFYTTGYHEGVTTESWDAQLFGCWFVALAAPFILVIVILSNLMVWFAPKVWLLKEIATLIK
ncbi:hypothetical protein D3C86_1952080 [compost metagenome]